MRNQHDYRQVEPAHNPLALRWHAQLPLPGIYGVPPIYTFEASQDEPEAGPERPGGHPLGAKHEKPLP